jgi:hypothetical protein
VDASATPPPSGEPRSPSPPPASLPAYRAPPPVARTSALAVVSLVLTLVFLLPAVAGPWWVEAIPFAFAFAALRKTARTGLRGRGLAILALVLSPIVAGLGFLAQRDFARIAEERFDGFLHALDAGKPDLTDAWLVPGEDAAAARDRWTKRLDAARQAVGGYRRVQVGSRLWGSLFESITTPDALGEEYGPKGLGPPEDLRTFWARAEFERGAVLLAFRLGKGEEPGGSAQALIEGEQKGDRRIVRDVRLFREVPDR